MRTHAYYIFSLCCGLTFLHGVLFCLLQSGCAVKFYGPFLLITLLYKQICKLLSHTLSFYMDILSLVGTLCAHFAKFLCI